MRNLNVNVLSAVDDVSRNGSQIDANQLISASFQTIFGDTDAAGTVKIQASNDICIFGNVASNFTVTHWSDIPSATATVVAGVCPLITLNTVVYQWIRVVFTSSNAGATTINVNMNALSQ